MTVTVPGTVSRDDIIGVNTNEKLGSSVCLSFKNDKVFISSNSYNSNTGLIRIYESSGTYGFNWNLLTTINGNSNDHFGYSIDATWDGDILCVGAPGNDKIYIYEDTSISKNWSSYVSNSISGNLNSEFGFSVSINKDTGNNIAVGAPGENSVSIIQKVGNIWSAAWSNTWTTSLFRNYIYENSGATGTQTLLYIDETSYKGSPRYGHSVSLSGYGNYLAVGAPGEIIPGSIGLDVSNVYYTNNTQPSTFYRAGGPQTHTRPFDTTALGHVVCYKTDNVLSDWRIHSSVTQYGPVIRGDTADDTDTMPRTFEPSHSWGFPACGKKVQMSIDGSKVMAGSPHYAKAGKGAFSSGKIEGWEYNKYNNTWILGKAPLVGEDERRLGQDFVLDYAGTRATSCTRKNNNGNGEVLVTDFNGTGWYEVAPGISFNISTETSGIHISNGALVAVADPTQDSNKGRIRFYDFPLTQIIEGNTLSSGYIAADSLRIGSNDNAVNDNVPKRISFGGTYEDNEYHMTEIENRSFYYDELNSDVDLQGNSELIFMKKSTGDMCDMIRIKANEFRIDNYLNGDGDYDHNPRLTMDNVGNFKLNAEMVFNSERGQADVKALLDIEGDCFTRRRLNAGFSTGNDTLGIDKFPFNILYDTRTSLVKSTNNSTGLVSNVNVWNRGVGGTSVRWYTNGPISGMINYHATEGAISLNTSSTYSENTNYDQVVHSEGFKMSFWIKLQNEHNTYSTKTLVGVGTLATSGVTGCRVQITSDRIQMNFGDYQIYPSTAYTFTANNWYHIWVQSDPVDNAGLTNSLIKINDVSLTLSSSGTVSNKGSNYDLKFYVGSNISSDSATNIYIGNIAFYPKISSVYYGSPENPTSTDMYNWGPPEQKLAVGGQAYIQSSLGINKFIPSYELDVNGDINFSGNIYQGGVLLPLSPWETGLPQYPITAMTSTSSGGYTASSSSFASTTYLAWKAFNHSIGSDAWISSVNYQGGIYIGANSTTYNGSSTVYGEWIQLHIPTSIIATQIKIAPFNNYSHYCAKTGKLLGSNDGSTWTEIHTFTNQTYTTGQYTDISFTNTNAYTHFRLVVQEVENTNSVFVVISEIKIVSDNPFIYTTNNYVGIGTNLPNYELDIVGNVNISSDLYVSDASISGDLNVSNINVFSTQQTNNLYTSNNAYVNFLNRISNYENSLVVSSDIDVFDGFGTSVSVSGDGNTAVIGTPYTVANNISNGGSVYIFVRSGNTWTQQAKLTSSDVDNNDYLGISVSVSHDGNTFITGAFEEDPNSTTDGGSAYVFTRSGTTWTQQAKLVSSDVESNDQFGISVSISGDGNTAIVGAHFEMSITPGYPSGSAYVFTRSGTSWSQEAKIVGSGVDRSEQFGESVDISYDGNTVIIGNKIDTVNSIVQSGSATVFTRSGTTWTEEGILTASDAASLDRFGVRVSISDDGNTALVGCIGKDTAYVFTRSGTTWSEEYKLVPWGNVSSTPNFGDYSVSLSGNGNVALVSAIRNSTQNNGINDGTTYVYVRIGTEWFDYTILSSLNPQNNGFFGYSVSTSYDSAISIIGASEESYYSNTSSGSVYTYHFTEGLNYYSRLTVSNDLEVLGNIYGNGTTLTGIALETDMTSNASRISTLETDMTSNASRISTLETDMTSNASRISTLETDMTSNASRISTLETDLTSNASRISTLETDLTSNASRISTLETLTLDDIANNGNTTSNTIQFTNTSTSLVTSSNVGIGTSTPSYKLDVVGTSNFTDTMYLSGSAGTSGQVLTSSGTGSAPTWTSSIWSQSGQSAYYNTGYVGIGTQYPTYKLTVMGDIYFNGALYPSGSAGTSGQVLTSSGTGSAPTWTTIASSPWSTGPSSTAGVYPLVAMTSDISGPHVTSASSVDPFDWYAWKAFNKVVGDEGWHSVVAYNSTTGNYSGSTSTTYDGSSTVNGEWIQLQFTTGGIATNEIEIAPRTNFVDRCAGDGIILGSNDGSTWTSIHSFSGQTYTNGNYTSITFTTSSIYTYLRLVVTKLAVAGDDTLNISEIRYTGVNATGSAYYTGDVGIGTTSPSYNLDVAGDINFTGNLYQSGTLFSGGGSSPWTTSGSDIYYSSNVGIGTSTPSAPLEIECLDITNNYQQDNGLKVKQSNSSYPATITIQSAAYSEDAFISFQYSSLGIFGWTFGMDSQDTTGFRKLKWSTSPHDLSSPKMTLIETGELGIGTENPSYKLDVAGDINFTGTLYQNGSVFSGGGGSSVWTTSGSNIYYTTGNVSIGSALSNGKLYIEPSGSTQTANAIYVYNPNNSAGQDAILTLRVAGSSAGDAYIAFDINGWASWACGVDTSDNHKFKWSSDWGDVGSNTKMTLDRYSGNLGIGTTSPSYKLHVAGDINFTGTLYQNGSVFSGGGGSSVWTTSGSNIYYNLGYVGIGTSSPYRLLDVSTKGTYGGMLLRNGDSNQAANGSWPQIQFGWDGTTQYSHFIRTRHNSSTTDNGIDFYVCNGTANNSLTTGVVHGLTIDIDGIGIGTMNPSYKLHVVGDIYATGNVTAYSDVRSKKNLKTIEDPVSKIEKINGYTYEKDGIAYTGLVAQELLEVLPEAVSGSEELGYGIAYGNMAGIFVEAIKELNAKIKALENKLSECKT